MKTACALFLAFAMVAVLPHAATAQGFDFAKGGPSEIQVYADDGLEWLSDSQRVIAHGNAKAVRGDVTVTGDTLVAYYRDAQANASGATPPAPTKPPAPGASGSGGSGGTSQIWRLDADGHVTITTTTDVATGIKAIYDLDKALLILHGEPARLTTPTQTFSATDSLEYYENDHMAVLRGNAEATGKDKKIQGDVLTAHFKERAKNAAPVKKDPAKQGSSDTGGQELSYADAFGHVILTTPQDVVTGDKGYYNAETGMATVTGAVKIVRASGELNGAYAQINLNTGISTLYGTAPGDAVKHKADGTFKSQAQNASGETRQPLFKGKVSSKPASPTPAPGPADAETPPNKDTAQ